MESIKFQSILPCDWRNESHLGLTLMDRATFCSFGRLFRSHPPWGDVPGASSFSEVKATQAVSAVQAPLRFGSAHCTVQPSSFCSDFPPVRSDCVAEASNSEAKAFPWRWRCSRGRVPGWAPVWKFWRLSPRASKVRTVARALWCSECQCNSFTWKCKNFTLNVPVPVWRARPGSQRAKVVLWGSVDELQAVCLSTQKTKADLLEEFQDELRQGQGASLQQEKATIRILK